MTIRLRAGGATDRGRVREINEDRFLIDDERLFAVADGVGGHQAGEVASQTAVETLRDSFTEPNTESLVEAVKQANRAVWEMAEANAEQRGMGTTLTALAVIDEEGEERLAVVNVGDSRVYLLQQGELEQLTEDHSLVEQLVREGQLTPEEAHVHPQRSIITRALGLEPEVEVDSWQLIPYRGDRMLLCSDGLTNEVTDTRIATALRSITDPEEAARELVSQARAHGGSDNITAVVVDVTDDDGRAEEASAALADEIPRAEPTIQVQAVRPDEAAEEAPRPAPPAAAPPPPPARDEAPKPRPRRLTWRVGVFVVVLVALLGASLAAVGWYARRTYFVGLAGNQVAIYKGRPGGLLWFDPTLDRRTSLRKDDVLPSRLDDLRRGKEESSLADAQRYVNNLRQEAAERTTTTTAPPPSTLPAP
jgi:PPM family protein phosphatase